MKEMSTDIVVIAAGPAGLAAGVQAAQDGARVIILEKKGMTGGIANGGMGILAVESSYQKRQMIDITVEKAWRMIMEYTHYNIDGRLVKRYFAQSADTIDWLGDMGVEFEGAYRYFPKSEPTWHIVKTGRKIGPAAARVMNQAMEKKARELGVEILFHTAGKKILKDENGRVSGVLAEDENGGELIIHCGAAIIACGGAGGNPKMIREETGFDFGRNLFTFSSSALTGDGLKMAWEAGADHVPVRIEQAAVCGGMDNIPFSVTNVMLQPNLLVNLSGKRVMDEEEMQNTTFLGNAAAHQKGHVLFSLVDTSIVEYYEAHGIDQISMVRFDDRVKDFASSVERAIAGGNRSLFKADSLKELAELTGIDADNLEDTVDLYNEYCSGYDEEFFKKARYLRPLVKAPYYAASVYPGGYGTVGGIRINENCECCDSEFEPVPGLYAAGADACNIYDDSYMFLLPGNSMGFAVNTGRIAGMEAAEYVQS